MFKYQLTDKEVKTLSKHLQIAIQGCPSVKEFEMLISIKEKLKQPTKTLEELANKLRELDVGCLVDGYYLVFGNNENSLSFVREELDAFTLEELRVIFDTILIVKETNYKKL